MVQKKVQHCCNKCFLSLRLEVLLEDVVGGSFLAPVSDDTGGTLDHLPGLALAVNLAQTGPLAQLHVAVNLDQRNAMLHAKSSDELLVHWFITVLSEDTKQSLSLVQGLGSLPDTPGEAVSDQGLLEDLLDGGVDIHGAGHGGGGWNIISLSVRHSEFLDVSVSLVEVNQAILEELLRQWMLSQRSPYLSTTTPTPTTFLNLFPNCQLQDKGFLQKNSWPICLKSLALQLPTMIFPRKENICLSFLFPQILLRLVMGQDLPWKEVITTLLSLLLELWPTQVLTTLTMKVTILEH